MKTNLIEIFQSIRAVMQPYETLGLNARLSSDTVYELWSERNVMIDGQKKNELYFAGLKILKNHVGFYFMPVHQTSEIKVVFHPSLFKLLKGLSCFQINKLDDALLEQIADALDKGFKIYKKNEWV
ncbi:hypothetical protein [Pedobacter sp. ASV28]|uniref:hypothetical protein n=1 Tax=Pedobacter sp. ASV28 TaxID=2795123 RepID=UPI0018EC1C46|nr:hypothetical protein [Pedobacter sp. ASV28]